MCLLLSPDRLSLTTNWAFRVVNRLSDLVVFRISLAVLIYPSRSPYASPPPPADTRIAITNRSAPHRLIKIVYRHSPHSHVSPPIALPRSSLLLRVLVRSGSRPLTITTRSEGLTWYGILRSEKYISLISFSKCFVLSIRHNIYSMIRLPNYCTCRKLPT